MERLRIVFMGTAELACASLEALTRHADVELVAVVTQPDRPKGRDLKPQPSPVKTQARTRALPLLQPERARDPDLTGQLSELRPDLIVVAAYGQILPPVILELPRHGCINVHTSLLPRHRGAAPIQWAIIEDDPETGVTIMQMDAGLDTGPILSQDRTAIRPEDNAQTLHDRLAVMGGNLLVRTIPDYVSGRIKPVPQPAEGVTHARKISKEDGRIDWSLPARAVWNRVRAFTPWPGTYGFIDTGAGPRLLKIWQAEVVTGASGPPGEVLAAGPTGIVVTCGEQALRVLVLQREGGKRLAAQDFLTGHPLKPGDRFVFPGPSAG
jgi:methionyl-tRNA formyltransferase